MPSGGKRPGSGRKTQYETMVVRVPPEDKAALKAKFGRNFNVKFREWVKMLLSDPS